ncbi:MAG: NADH-quinone oxidoreductase subunit B family protein [Anaerolineae bacterium]|nr:NADH-quinone oxidoreductase subunit B family protein [Anaerolineae bacterium]
MQREEGPKACRKSLGPGAEGSSRQQIAGDSRTEPTKRRLQRYVDAVVRWARRKSPWILHYNSGGCNGCDIEILATLTPRYDVERLGILKEGSPRHADILLCTGPVTLQSRDRLRRIYEQMPEPKWVVSVGTCSCSGGVFKGAINVVGSVDQVVPVDMYIPGCPCRPEAIIDGLAQLLRSIE